jgi:hypothetical protein
VKPAVDRGEILAQVAQQAGALVAGFPAAVVQDHQRICDALDGPLDHGCGGVPGLRAPLLGLRRGVVPGPAAVGTSVAQQPASGTPARPRRHS